MHKAVFLDRDGVVNHSIVRNGKPYAPRTMEEFVINPDIHTLSRLRNLGYRLIVVTNQPDIGNGLMPREAVDAMHAALYHAFHFDDILTCPHTAQDQCACRKPKPGMLIQSQVKFNIDLRTSYMVGDRWRDVEAGQAAGCATVFLDYGYAEQPPAAPPDFTCNSLLAAVDWIESKTVQSAKDIVRKL
jgi:D-glycero-D-manno-heptose 1,7-bisphosphate phosphatase